ncbi:MAG: hypothetical protein L3J82_00440 [Planctomycetes bacterium]|nr:hypothetical protein [Planctomycetota bacterium]
MAETITPSIFRRIFQSPLVLREIRVACRSWKLVVTLSIYLLIQCSIFAIIVASNYDDGVYDDPTRIGLILFITMSVVMIVVMMMVFPAFSATSIASEHEKKSFDLLLLTPLSAWEIAIGKFMAAGIQASVFLIASIPLYALANTFGGIEPMAFLMVLLLLVLFSVFISFVGVYSSSLQKKVLPAAVITYLFSFLIGMTLLVGLIVLMALASWAAMFAPTLLAMLDPTVTEGIFYAISITLTCSIYCTYLFLNTTNRLKSTAHNKSTNLRIFWTVTAFIVPAQVFFYYMFCRIHSHDSVTLGVIILAIYVGLMMLVPSLSAPAEPVIPSRRVRRSMAKMPKAFTGGGGSLFFPGSLRGVIHSAIITLITGALLTGAAWFAYGQLDERNKDITNLRDDYSSIVSSDSDIATRMTSMMGSKSYADPDVMRQTVEDYTDGVLRGFLLFMAAIIIVVLTSAQFSWRVSLNGLTKNLATIVGGLLLTLWLVGPYIVQMIFNSASNDYGTSISQFSPINGMLQGIRYGELIGYTPEPAAYQNITGSVVGDTEYSEWLWFMGSAVVLWAGLGLWNAFSFRSVKAKITAITGDDSTGQALASNVAAVAPVAQETAQLAALSAVPDVAEEIKSDDESEPELPDASEIETINDDQAEDES